jgi:hypothetical protein
MRKLWIRIGIGAGAIFAAGMFVVTLARQVRASAVDAIRSGGRFTMPLAILPFEVDGERVGSVREIKVERSSGGRAKRVSIVVNLKGFDPEGLADCALVLGGHRRQHSGLFDCLDEAELADGDYVRVGEARFEPRGLVRPILLHRAHARDWFDDAEAAEVILQADADGANLLIEGEEGDASLKLQANEAGLMLHARDASGREVVKIQADAKGLNVNVEAKGKTP